MNKIKIGLDIHGVIDARKEFFSALSKTLVAAGHEVHIITGPPVAAIKDELASYGIEYTHIFSIVDYHASIGTDIKWDSKGHAHFDPYLWDKTKAEYCQREGIDLHLDDSDTYNYFFKTPYARFYSKDTSRVRKTQI